MLLFLLIKPASKMQIGCFWWLRWCHVCKKKEIWKWKVWGEWNLWLDFFNISSYQYKLTQLLNIKWSNFFHELSQLQQAHLPTKSLVLPESFLIQKQKKTIQEIKHTPTFRSLVSIFFNFSTSPFYDNLNKRWSQKETVINILLTSYHLHLV